MAIYSPISALCRRHKLRIAVNIAGTTNFIRSYCSSRLISLKYQQWGNRYMVQWLWESDCLLPLLLRRDDAKRTNAIHYNIVAFKYYKVTSALLKRRCNGMKSSFAFWFRIFTFKCVWFQTRLPFHTNNVFSAKSELVALNVKGHNRFRSKWLLNIHKI